MDDTDRKLMLLLFEDPRMPLRDLSERLGISRQAVNHRLQALAAAGVFKDIKAGISNYYLDGVPVAIWGRFRTSSLDVVLERLGESEFTNRVTVAGGNELFIFGYLKRASELSDYVEFVKKAAEMPELTVGLPSYGDGINPLHYDGGQLRKEDYRRLTPVDLRIIASLQEDARRPIAEIARVVGVSAKTVRRRLEGMRRDGSLDYDSPWDIPSGEDMLTLLYVSLREGVDKVRTAKRLLSIDPIHLIFFRSYGNLPNLIVGLISSDKMTVIRRILRLIGQDEAVSSVTPNLIYSERGYNSWECRLVPVTYGRSRRARKSL